MRVFVYGSLKKGFHNHRVMEVSEGKLLGQHTTPAKYTMYSLGGYPAVVGNGNSTIKGEVYEVDNLEQLDYLEGYPSYYGRELIDTPYGDAWIYTFNGDVSNYEQVPNGVW